MEFERFEPLQQRGFVETQDPEFNRVVGFERAVGSIAVIRTVDTAIDFSINNPIEHAIKQFLTYEYDGKNTLLLPSELAGYEEVKAVNFSPLVARGGRHSGHGVFFGNLHFDHDNQLPVAIKPHTINPQSSSLKDYLNNIGANQLGFFNLQPAGVLLRNSGVSYSLTVLKDDLTTLDTIDWSEFYPKFSDNPGMIQIWSQVARQSALLHANGTLEHGDLAGRNIAITTDDNVFFIDWERATLQLGQPRDAEVRYNHSFGDLSVLAESMCRPPHDDFKAGLGIFYAKTGNWWQGFKDLVFDEYVDYRMGMAANESNHNHTLQDVTEEIEVLSDSLQEEIAVLKEVCKTI